MKCTMLGTSEIHNTALLAHSDLSPSKPSSIRGPHAEESSSPSRINPIFGGIEDTVTLSGNEATSSHSEFEDSPYSTSEEEDPNELNEEEELVLQKLKARDQEVRAHESAHLAASGGLAQGGPTYSYQIGPDGRQYAVGGEVSIDTSTGNTTEETIQKMYRVIAAAMAPGDPSAQDTKVAAQAAQKVAEARTQQVEEQTEEQKDTSASTEIPSEESERTDEEQATEHYESIGLTSLYATTIHTPQFNAYA